MNITELNFENKPIRTLIKDNEIWFIANDICNVLGLTNPTEALKRLYQFEKSTITVSDGNLKRGNPSRIIISESGLYKLIMRSTKSEAIRFQDWVAQDVLPTIRKSGKYVCSTTVDTDDPIGSLQQIIENMYQASKGIEISYHKTKEEVNTLLRFKTY